MGNVRFMMKMNDDDEGLYFFTFLNWNMDHFKFSFLSRGQLESWNLDKILPLFKILPY